MAKNYNDKALTTMDASQLHDKQGTELDRLLTKNEAAQLLHIARRTLDDWMRRKLIPYFKIERAVRFRAKDMLEHIESKYRA